MPILGEKYRVPSAWAHSRRLSVTYNYYYNCYNSSRMALTVPMMRWLWGKLLAAGGSEPKGSPYTNKTQALAKLEPFLCHASVPLPCAGNAAQG